MTTIYSTIYGIYEKKRKTPIVTISMNKEGIKFAMNEKGEDNLYFLSCLTLRFDFHIYIIPFSFILRLLNGIIDQSD